MASGPEQARSLPGWADSGGRFISARSWETLVCRQPGRPPARTFPPQPAGLDGHCPPEVNVSQAPARPRPRARYRTLNSGGQRHPLIIASAAYTIVAGPASFVLGMLSHSHLIGTILGVTGFIAGLLAPMLSSTRAERSFIGSCPTAPFVR